MSIAYVDTSVLTAIASRLRTGPLERTTESAFETVIEVALWWMNRKLARMP